MTKDEVSRPKEQSTLCEHVQQSIVMHQHQDLEHQRVPMLCVKPPCPHASRHQEACTNARRPDATRIKQHCVAASSLALQRLNDVG